MGSQNTEPIVSLDLIKAVYASSQDEYEDAADEFDAALAAHDRRLLRHAEMTLREMAGPWGDDQMWITTGTKVAAVAGDVIKQMAEDES